LFTIALLSVVPVFVGHVLDGRDAVHESDFGLHLYLRENAALGIASLAIILIGLMVTWAGYVKKVRWAWFVMFVIVWGWALPNLVYRDVVYPLSRHLLSISDFPSLLAEALLGAGFPRDFARGFVQLTVIFALMVVALVLPLKAFAQTEETQRAVTKPTRKLFLGSAVSLLVVATGLLAWVHLRVYWR